MGALENGSKLWETQKRYLGTIALTLRPNTVTNSRTVTDGFIRFLQAEYPELSSFSQLERTHIEAWLHFLASRPIKKSTRRNAVIKLRVFLERLQEWRWKEAPRDPYLARRPGDLPPEDRCLPRPLPPAIDRALCEELEQGKAALFSKAILLLRATGLRCGELLDLKVDSLTQIRSGEWELRVPLGKLHSERNIPVDETAAKLFAELLELRESPPPALDPETGKREHFLLMRPNGRRISREGLRYHLARAEKRAALGDHPTLHRLRHTYATEILRAGVSLQVLMKLLGHRSIKMTLRYAEITGVDVRRVYQSAMANIAERYEIPVADENDSTNVEATTTPAAILKRIESLAAQLEVYRRDRASQSRKKQIQRFVERLLRLANDFKDVAS